MRLSEAPTRVKIRSTTPMPGAAGGHETAYLSEQDDQANLTNCRALARHVRSGDQQNLSLVAVEVDIVGNETSGGQLAFDDGMTSTANRDHA